LPPTHPLSLLARLASGLTSRIGAVAWPSGLLSRIATTSFDRAAGSNSRADLTTARIALAADPKMRLATDATRMQRGLSRSAEFIPHDLTTDTDGGMNSALRAAWRCQVHFHGLWSASLGAHED